MGVVINDFEVVPGPSQQAQPPPPPAQPDSEAPPPPSPEDLERSIRQQLERLARVRAH